MFRHATLRAGLGALRQRASAVAKPAAFVTASAAATAAATVAVCEAAAPPTPPFKLGAARYDQNTYEGRLAHIQELVDMRSLFTTDEEVAAAQKLLSEFEKGGKLPPGVDDEAMWHAQKTVGAVIHAPTGEKMLSVGRMSAFVPCNVPIAAGLLMAQSVPAVIFSQWLNQSYNVVNNYVNRAGPTVEMGPLATSYALAVGVSVSIAVAAGKLMKAKPGLAKLGPFVPYLAVIMAGSCNVSFTRMDEMQNGIDVCDEQGNTLGRSVAAGKVAVFKTVTTRSMFLPIFPLLIPPLVMKAILATGAVMAQTPLAIGLEILTIAASLTVGLPRALAIQPLRMELDVASLEPEFQNLKGKGGERITHVYANKGM